MKAGYIVSGIVLAIGLALLIGIPALAEGLTPTELHVDIITVPSSAQSEEAVAISVRFEVHGWEQQFTPKTADFDWALYLDEGMVNSGTFELGTGFTLKSVGFIVGASIPTGDRSLRIDVWYGSFLADSSSHSIYIEQTGTLPPPPDKYVLSTSAFPTGTGFVIPESGAYDEGTSVTLTAYPNDGYEFSHWSNAISGSTNPITITMDSHMDVIANFVQINEYTLTISATPWNGGFTIPSSGDYTYSEGELVTATAYPYEGFIVWGWTIPPLTVLQEVISVTVEMTGDKHITAHFKENVKPTYDLTTLIIPSGGGYVNPSSGTFEEGKVVVLTATAYEGYEFYSWSGVWDSDVMMPPALPHDETITVTMNKDRQAIATFKEVVPQTDMDLLYYSGIIMSIIGVVGLVATRVS